LTTEMDFHNRQAHERAADLGMAPTSFALDDDVYLDHETWIRPALDRLGDLRGLRVLDYGCGHGMAAVVLARRGALVTGFDLSHGYLAEAWRRTRASDVSVELVQADGARLPFAAATFDRLWGNAVLHHLDLSLAGREIRRVLKPGGIAVFCEPWGENPALGWVRNRLPYPGKSRTPDEAPLLFRHVRQLRQIFPIMQVRGYQLLSMARRVLPQGRLVAGLDWCDSILLERLPVLQRYCRYVVLTLPG
jgi:SAM-dependent methyltransferase